MTEWITRKEAAARAHVSLRTIAVWVRAGFLATRRETRNGKSCRVIATDSLDRYIASRGTPVVCAPANTTPPDTLPSVPEPAPQKPTTQKPATTVLEPATISIAGIALTDIRWQIIGGDPWFCVEDVGRWLGTSTPPSRLVEDLPEGHSTLISDQGGPPCGRWYVSSGGLNIIVARNRTNPEAATALLLFCADVLRDVISGRAQKYVIPTGDALTLALEAALELRKQHLALEAKQRELEAEQAAAKARIEVVESAVVDTKVEVEQRLESVSKEFGETRAFVHQHFVDNRPRGGELTCHQMAVLARWRSNTGHFHRLAVAAIARASGYEQLGFVVTRMVPDEAGKLHESPVFTPAGIQAFMDNINTRYPYGVEFTFTAGGKNWTVVRR